MERYSVYVSLDCKHDRHYQTLLQTWNGDPMFRFTFRDEILGQIDGSCVDMVKTELKKKIRSASNTLVIVGEYCDHLHPKHDLIGSKNWVNLEIAISKDYGKKIVAYKLDPAFPTPEEMQGADVAWVDALTEESLIRAMEPKAVAFA